jgi:prefoldin subunit 5
MDNLKEIERIIKQKLEPYEEKIKELENCERVKEQEIQKLKESIHNLNQIIEELKQNKAISTSLKK